VDWIRQLVESEKSKIVSKVQGTQDVLNALDSGDFCDSRKCRCHIKKLHDAAYEAATNGRAADEKAWAEAQQMICAGDMNNSCNLDEPCPTVTAPHIDKKVANNVCFSAKAFANGPECHGEQGASITDPDECEKAAQDLGYTWEGETSTLHKQQPTGSWGHAPFGCHVGTHTGALFLNTYHGQTGRSIYTTLCKVGQSDN
jgi:hypothetical protein